MAPSILEQPRVKATNMKTGNTDIKLEHFPGKINNAGDPGRRIALFMMT
jgi:hypothetical protein